jgi:hypothetical protein
MVEILNGSMISFCTYDILEDEEVREGKPMNSTTIISSKYYDFFA